VTWTAHDLSTNYFWCRAPEPRTTFDDFQATLDRLKVFAAERANSKQSLTERARILSSPPRTGLSNAAAGEPPVWLYSAKT
jgi:hypothetical protein